MNKRRVAILTPIVWSPQREHFSGVIRTLSATLNGDVFTSSGEELAGRAFSSFRLFCVRNDGGAWFKVRRFLLQTLRLCREHRTAPYDAIIAYDPYASGIAAWVAARLCRARLIVEMNGDYHEVAPHAGSLKGSMMRSVMRWTFGRADGIRVLNESQAHWVRHNFPQASVFKHAEYAALHVFCSTEPSSGTYFLSVGFPFRLKGVDLVIAAFRRLGNQFPDVSLRIMGYAPDDELVAFRRLAGDDPRIVFVRPGWIADVAHQMHGCIALVNAAHTEALGRVHLEAMAAGKPVIASRTNGALECVEDEVTGLLFDVGDVDGLTRALERVLADPVAVGRMGMAGRVRVDEFFGEEAYGRNVTAMIEVICRGGSPTAGPVPS